MTSKVFICGPYVYTDASRAVFVSAEGQLRDHGIAPCSGPHDITYPDGATPYDRARLRMAMLASCERVCLLDGWSMDITADFEEKVARHLGMEVQPLCIMLAKP